MYLMLGLVFALLVAIFAVQNAQAVPITLFTRTFTAPLALVILGMAVAGALLTGLVLLAKQVGLGFRLWNVKAEHKRVESERQRLEEQVKILQAEVAALRAGAEAAKGKPGPAAEEGGTAGT